MVVGSIIRGDNSGLGTIGREFWDHGVINKALIVPGWHYKVFPKRFVGDSKITAPQEITPIDLDWLFDGIDSLLLFETPFRWDVLVRARKENIKSSLMVMHEGLPEHLPYYPTQFLCPSDLDYDLPIEPKIRINVPVNTDRIKWKLRKKANVFVHNAGHGGIGGRNGTPELLAAMQYVKSDIKLIIRTQSFDFEVNDPRVEIRYANYENYWDIWDEGDVFIFPEKFNGLSLPIQEACAAGMMIMSTDRYPFNNWLPKEPLIPVKELHKQRVMREIEVAEVDPRDIAKKIDEWAGKDISSYSQWGKDWAFKNNWEMLQKTYYELLG